MSVPICCGSFTKDAGTVTQTVPNIRDRAGRSFTPTCGFFWTFGHIGAVGVSNAEAIWSFGFDNFSSRRALGTRQSDNKSVPWPGPLADGALICNSYYHKTASVVIPLLNSVGTQFEVAGLATNPVVSSFDFQWTASVAGFTGVVVHFMVFGGTVTMDVASELTTGSGTKAYTSGISGTPTAIVMMMPQKTADSAGAAEQVFLANLGGFNAAGCQWSFSVQSDGDAGFPPASGRYQRTNKCVTLITSAGVAVQASAVSIGSATFSVNYDARTFDGPLAYAALHGVDVSIFPVDQPAGGVVTLSGLGKAPDGVLMCSVGAVASTSVQSEGQLAIAASMGSSQVSGWCGLLSGVNPTATANYDQNTSGLISATPSAGGATVTSRVSLVTLQSDGLRITMGLADATARQMLCFVFGGQIYAPASPCAPTTTIIPIYPPPPVAYEDPCAITRPKLHVKIKTESNTYRIGVGPLRETAAMGGFKVPRVLEIGPCVKVTSDLVSGAWSAQTMTLRNADTDRFLRAISAARGSFRNCDIEAYLTSKAQSLAELPPRVIFAGKAYGDSADENMALGITVNDLIGVDYSLFSEEKQIPQRVVTVNDFPLAPEDSLGLAIPILGGSLNAFAHANAGGITGPGIVDGVYVGQVTIGGAAGTPGPTDLTAVVAALQASVTAGTCVADFGPRIGYADAQELQNLGTVPSTYAGLAAIIGSADLDDLLNATAVTGGNVFECVAIAGHAISEILATNASTPPAGPSIWINDVPIDPAEIGSSVWCPQIPGDTTWASDISSDLFTDIVGLDGTTRRYTLILFDPSSAYGLQVANGDRVHVECVGMEDEGDGMGDPILNYFDLYLHLMVNFLLQNYQAGAWLSIPQFLFSDGVTLLDRVNAGSFVDAKDVTALQVAAGYQGSFAIGSGGQSFSIRDVIANANRSGGCLLAQNDFGQLFIKVLDRRRSEFLLNPATGLAHRTLRDKVDILPGFNVQPKPDWQVNQLAYQYAENYHDGSWDRGFGGGGNQAPANDLISQGKYGVIKKTMDFPYVRDDATALAVATYYLALLAELPKVAAYSRRGLCGLEDDLTYGVPITHYNGYGGSGYVDNAFWILSKTFNPKTMHCDFVSVDVDGILT